MLRSDFDDALLRQISRRGGGDGVFREDELNASPSFCIVVAGTAAAGGAGAGLSPLGVAGNPFRCAAGRGDALASFIGGGGGNGSCIIISFSRADGSSYGFLDNAVYADEKSLCCPSRCPSPRSGESEASLPFVSELRCEEYMCIESEEVFE